MAKSKYKVTQPKTYEQAVATALLKARDGMRLQGRGRYKYSDLMTGTLALRRLRVRAGLTP